jgi:hypothetical protein
VSDDLDRLEAIAKAARAKNPGPWTRYDWRTPVTGHARFSEICDSSPRPDHLDADDHWQGKTVLETDGGYYEPKGATAEHIAAFSPDVVLRLIARVRELEGYCAELFKYTPEVSDPHLIRRKAIARKLGLVK